MNPRVTRILGIDTSLRSTGLGTVEAEGSRMKMIDCRALRMPAKYPVSRCLAELRRGIHDFIDLTQPDAASIEGAFFFKNVSTAMVLGQARGVAIEACTARNLPMYEYAPRRVKQAVVGFGAASKEQVTAMITRLLNLPDEPQEDAADALAMAICHLHGRTGIAGLSAESI
jgi:crossover junction endodeoxyribonuclease RuvC